LVAVAAAAGITAVAYLVVLVLQQAVLAAVAQETVVKMKARLLP
tara:strand:+ start:401 stop:532 length:132 start_codon:yes stop_codon:yes gene_type:complete